MSFLDSLENNLKAMEAIEEKDTETIKRKRLQREAERVAALQSAPHAEALRNGAFTNGLLIACRTIGHRRRVLVRPTWVESTLRLEGGGKKLELRPTPGGVFAVFFADGSETSSRPLDLTGDPAALVEEWLR